MKISFLHYTHGNEPLSSEMTQAAYDYISEDHVDGEDSEEAQLEREQMNDDTN